MSTSGQGWRAPNLRGLAVFAHGSAVALLHAGERALRTKTILVVATLVAGVAGVAGAGPQTRALPDSMLERIVMARIYQTGKWTLAHQTPDSAGKLLAGLKPTYVTGLLRVKSTEALTQKEAD